MIDPKDPTVSAVLDTARRYAERELREGVYGRDAYPHADFSEAVIKGAAEAGLLRMCASEDLGGIGLPPEAWALVLMEISYDDAGIAACLLAHAMGVQALLEHGEEESLEKYLGGGDEKLFAYPLYLQADDVQGAPAAREIGGGWSLTGVARLAANAPVAGAAVVAAELDSGEPALFIVDMGEALRPEPVETLGLRSCPVGHVDFADLTLPPGALLERGAEALAELHRAFMPAAAAILLGRLKSSLDYAVEYGSERYQGGCSIHGHGQLRSMYAGMAAEHETLRRAILSAVSEDSSIESRISVKIMAAEAAVRACTDGVQLLGGYGYTMEYPQERAMRDARQAAALLGSPSRLRLSLMDLAIGECG